VKEIGAVKIAHEFFVLYRAIALGEDDAVERYRLPAVQVD
jgi:hypothetical protein